VVARAFGGLVLRDAARPGPAAHDGAGGRFVLVPADGAAYAIDVECRGAVPAPLAALGLTLEAWTEIEVEAKLTATPAHLVLKARLAGEAAAPGLALQRADTATHLIAVGRKG
jgi:hypothetical protein